MPRVHRFHGAQRILALSTDTKYHLMQLIRTCSFYPFMRNQRDCRSLDIDVSRDMSNGAADNPPEY